MLLDKVAMNNIEAQTLSLAVGSAENMAQSLTISQLTSFYVALKRPSTDFEVLNLQKGRSGWAPN